MKGRLDTEPLRRSNKLKRRMIVSLLGLVALPLVAAFAAQFLVVRDDIVKNQKIQLTRETGQAAEQITGEFSRCLQSASLLSALPETMDVLKASGKLPAGFIPSSSHGGLNKIELLTDTPPPVLPSINISGENLLCRTLVTNSADSSPGILQLTFSLSGLQNSLTTHRTGEKGGAVLFTAEGLRLAGNKALPLPPALDSGTEGFIFASGGESYFASVAQVKNPSGDATGRLFVAMIQPMEQMYGQFDSMLLQLAILPVAGALLAVLLAWKMTNTFLAPVLEIRRGAEIISRINLNHRIVLNTDDELEELAHELNHMAENLGKVYGELEERITEATCGAEEEQKRLAVILRTMVDGVVVTNSHEEIILMNPRARIALGRGFTSGIGAPVTDIFPSDRLKFHIKRLRMRWERGQETVEDIIFPFYDGKLLKGSISIISGASGELAGYLLVFRDLTDTSEQSRCFAETVREMPRFLRGSVATSRSLVESLLKHPEMPHQKQHEFLQAIKEEMLRLSESVTAIEEAANAAETTRWTPVSSDPRELFYEALLPGISIDENDQFISIPHVHVEPFSWVASLRSVFIWFEKLNRGERPVTARLLLEEDTVVTAIRIDGEYDVSQAEFESIPVSSADEQPLSLGESVRRNHGEIWIKSANHSLEARMALMRSKPAIEVLRFNGLVENEPEFYDFDLFLPRPVVELKGQLTAELQDLEYVVFDTETTGMRLSQGDRVVSISGVRIRRGKIQKYDVFHTLVNPGRHIPPESVEIHNIDDQTVANAPFMREVYPQFVDYIGDSVLVAHNAAFDMKCLQIASAESGLPRIDNPVLDTLLLSYALHNEIEGHSLEAMAERLGITIDGRHSSMGDATATAEIFLRLMLLLPGRGVRTLADARGFCDQHLLLRWRSSGY